MGKLTKAQRARLDKLATYLEALPADYSHFGMAHFIFDHGDAAAIRKYVLHNGGVQHCGTAACAVGHGPAAGILMPPETAALWPNSWLMWTTYLDLFLGKRDANSDRSMAVEWMFGGDWDDVDDTHFGAAARIRFFLAQGVPDDFSEDYNTYWDEFLPLYAPYRIDAKAPANA